MPTVLTLLQMVVTAVTPAQQEHQVVPVVSELQLELDRVPPMELRVAIARIHLAQLSVMRLARMILSTASEPWRGIN